MTGQSGLPSDYDKILDRSAARNSGLGANQTVATNRDIVSNLDEIIDLGALPDQGLTESGAINGRISSDFYIVSDDHRSNLRDLFMSAVDEFITETIRSDDHPGLQADSFSKDALRSDYAARHQPRIIAHDSPAPNEDLSLQMDAVSNPRPGFNHAKRAYGRGCGNRDVRRDPSGRVDSGGRSRPKG